MPAVHSTGSTAGFRRRSAARCCARRPRLNNSTEISLQEANSDEQSSRTSRRHWRRRSDRLLAAVPHRFGRNAGQGSAGHPAVAGDPGREGAKGAQGRDDGTGRLRIPAARRHGRAQRSGRGFQGHRVCAARRRPAARPGHGAQGPARRQCADLHRAGQGARQGGQSQRQGAGRRQPRQHQRLHRDEVGTVAAEGQFHRDAAARPQSRAVAARDEDRQAGHIDPEAGGVGQPFADDVPGHSLRDD